MLSPAQYYGTVICSTFTSTLSTVCSVAVIIAARKGQSKSVYQKLVLSLSAADAVSSLFGILHPYMLPRYTREAAGLLWASGNKGTCNMVGFFFVVSYPLVSFFSFNLSAYFLSKVRYNTPDRVFAQKFLRPATVIALVICLAMGFVSLGTGSIEPRIYYNICHVGDCVIGDLEGCPDVYETSLGYYLGLTQVFLIAAPALLALVLTICVYCTVRKKLAQSRGFVFGASETGNSDRNFRSRLFRGSSSFLDTGNSPDRPQQQQQDESERSVEMAERIRLQQADQERYRDQKLAAVRTQAVLYCIAYWNSFFWYFFYRVAGDDDLELERREGEPGFYAISVACYFFLPLQGFVNFLVYTRPRYLNWRRQHPDQGRYSALRNAMSFDPVNATDHLSRGGVGLGRQQSSSFTLSNRRPSLLTQQIEQGNSTCGTRRRLSHRFLAATERDSPTSAQVITEEQSHELMTKNPNNNIHEDKMEGGQAQETKASQTQESDDDNVAQGVKGESDNVE